MCVCGADVERSMSYTEPPRAIPLSHYHRLSLSLIFTLTFCPLPFSISLCLSGELPQYLSSSHCISFTAAIFSSMTLLRVYHI